jgi:hypothetical protein
MISSLRNKKMKANVFQYATYVPFDVPDLPIQNNIRYIPKVFQSEQVINVDAESVQSLAFMFKFVDFEKVAFTESQGMRNVYLLCGRYNQRNGMTQIRDDICLKFPSCYQGHRDLYGNSCIMSIKRGIVKTFSRSSQNQGSVEISKGQIINVNPQVWDHMKHATDDVDIASLSVDRKRVFHETSSGMDMARRSCTQTCELR